MCSLLLKKALPFALTFVVGSLAVGLLGAFGSRPWKSERRAARYYRHYGACDHGRGPARYLVAETKPLVTTFKPDARWPREWKTKGDVSDWELSALVTFGADGRVQAVEPGDGRGRASRGGAMKELWEAAERAAWQIQFEPETVDGVPVTVTREVKIRFMGE
jgi:hypothetical protein